MVDLGEYREWLKALATAQISVDLRGRIDPSDLVQQTICEALRDLPKQRGATRAEMMGWLRSVLRCNLIDAFRKLRFAPRVSLDDSLALTAEGMSRFLAADHSDVDARLQRDERALLLADRLQQLTPAQAEAILLKHCHGMSVEQICRHMDRSPEAVGGLLRHGMRRLRELLPREE
ncbi:MAG: sigma-70 family RNA polymerase sigma factor [Pirellulales bacterium]